MNRVLLFGVLLFTSACASFKLTPAADFAVMPSSGSYDLRAATAEGVVLGVRDLPNRRPRGSLTFWSRLVVRRLARDGYAIDEVRAVRTEGGLHGRQIRARREESGAVTHYWVTLFVEDGGFLGRNHVYCVEAAGEEEHFQSAQPAIERAIRSFRT